jgi:hypothetical protein
MSKVINKVTRTKPLTIFGIVIGALTALFWIYIEGLGFSGDDTTWTAFSDAIRFLFIGLFCVMTAILAIVGYSYRLVRETLPISIRDEEPPFSAIVGFGASYLFALGFIVVVSIVNIGTALNWELLSLATATYGTGLVSGYRILRHNERRLANKIIRYNGDVV